MSLFDARAWASVDPRCFPFGDGVYGVLRETRLSFQEWREYFMKRVELEYPSPRAEDLKDVGVYGVTEREAFGDVDMEESALPPVARVSRLSPVGVPLHCFQLRGDLQLPVPTGPPVSVRPPVSLCQSPVGSRSLPRRALPTKPCSPTRGCSAGGLRRIC
jgi:hypothetical protein